MEKNGNNDVQDGKILDYHYYSHYLSALLWIFMLIQLEMWPLIGQVFKQNYKRQMIQKTNNSYYLV